MDTVDREKIVEYIDTYRKVYDFAEIIPASALRAKNLDTVIDMIFKYLPYGPQFYDEDTVTDQPERAIVAEIIREKALHALDDEIPHGIAVYIDRMKAERDRISLTLTQRSSASVIPTRELSSEKAVQCSKKSEAMRVTRSSGYWIQK